LNQLANIFREIDQIIYDMRTVLNNEGGFPIEKMMIIKKLLDVQYDSLFNVKPPYFIIDVNFCRQASKQIHNLKSIIDKKKATLTISNAANPEIIKVKTPPTVVDVNEQIAAKTREILKRDYSEPIQTSMLAKYISTLGSQKSEQPREREMDMKGCMRLTRHCRIFVRSLCIAADFCVDPKASYKERECIEFRKLIAIKTHHLVKQVFH
jgi:hypothetical protein